MADEKNTVSDDRMAELVAKARGTPGPSAGGRPAVAAEPPKPKIGAAMPPQMQQLLQGLTFGFGDEATAGLRSLVRPEKYEDLLAAEREAMSAYEKENPLTALALQGVGSIPTMAIGSVFGAPVAGAARLMSGLPKLPQLAQSGLQALARGAEALKLAPTDTALKTLGKLGMQGAEQGAISGFGTGEGGFKQRVGNAVEGGITGGVASPVVGGVAGAIPKVAKPVFNALGWTNPEKTAQRMVANKAAAEGLTPTGIVDKLEAQAASSGAKPELPIDISDNLASLGADIRMAGDKKELIRKQLLGRQEQQGTRLGADLEQVLGQSANARNTAKQILKDRSTSAATNYGKAWQEPARMTEEIANILDTPAGKKAYAEAAETLGNLSRLPGATEIKLPKLVYDEAGNLKRDSLEPMSIQALHALKKGFDDVIDTYRDGTTGKLNLDNKGHSVLKLKEHLMDQMPESYRKAAEEFSERSDRLQALVYGKNALKSMPDEVVDIYKSLSKTDQELYRLGVLQELKDRISKRSDTLDFTKQLFHVPQIRETMKSIGISQEAVEKWLEQGAREERMLHAKNRVLVGSHTPEREAGMKGLEDAATIGSRFLGGDFLGAGKQGLQALVRRGQGIRGSTADAMHPYLFTEDLPKLRTLMEGAEKRLAADQLLQSRLRKGAEWGIGHGVGNVSGIDNTR